jgi:outer membrane immunogenic protein
MNRNLGWTIASVITLSIAGVGAASAADMAVKAPPPPVVQPTCVWCGFYIGLNAGGSWDKNAANYTFFGSVPPTFASASPEPSGFIGGGQAGYNWQWDTFVVGVEGDIAWRDRTATANLLPFAPGNVTDQVNTSNKQGWIATLRPKVGFAWGNVMAYVTGGGAFGEVDHSYQEIRVTTGQQRTLSDSTTKGGWTVGAGFDWMFLPNWSLGAEYLHIDLGSTTLAQGPSVSGGLAFPASQTRFENKSDIVRAKLDWHFGGPGPVVARY